MTNLFQQQAELDRQAARGEFNDDAALDDDERQDAKHERRADRADERAEDAEEFDFERDCGARP